MKSYDDYRKAHERALRLRKWSTFRQSTSLWFNAVTALIAFTTVVGWLFLGACLLLANVVQAEPVTDMEVEQAYWLNAYNECRHTMNLKGHKVEHSIRVCNSVADIELQAD